MVLVVIELQLIHDGAARPLTRSAGASNDPSMNQGLDLRRTLGHAVASERPRYHVNLGQHHVRPIVSSLG